MWLHPLQCKICDVYCGMYYICFVLFCHTKISQTKVIHAMFLFTIIFVTTTKCEKLEDDSLDRFSSLFMRCKVPNSILVMLSYMGITFYFGCRELPNLVFPTLLMVVYRWASRISSLWSWTSTPSNCGTSTLATSKEHHYDGALVVGELKSNGDGHCKRSMEVGVTLVKWKSL